MHQQPQIITPHDITLTCIDTVFMPTPETYMLIDIARSLIPWNAISSIADLGTGTGVIANTLAKQFSDKRFFATDIDKAALQLAEYNASQNAVHNIQFFCNEWQTWISAELPAPIECIISNPPYIGDVEYNDSQFFQTYPEARHEPQHAIRTYDALGVRPYVQILAESRRLATTLYLFQCNTDSLQNVLGQINRREFLDAVLKDTNNHDRYLFLTRQATN